MASLDVRAVAALHNVSPDVVRRAERDGFIPRAARTPGGHRRWDVSQLEEIRAGLSRRRLGSQDDESAIGCGVLENDVKGERDA
jgi:DNA-binding transcriptional MerR regulator